MITSIYLNALIAWRLGIRSHAMRALLVLGALILGVAYLAGAFSLRQPLVVALDMGLSGLRFLGLILVLFWMQEAFAKDVERRTITFALANPIPRGTYVLVRFLGVAGLVLLTVATWGGVLFLMGRYADWGYAVSSTNTLNSGYLWVLAGIVIDLLVIRAFFVFLSSISETPVLAFIVSLGFGIAARSLGVMIDCLAQLQWHEQLPALRSVKIILTGFPPEAEATLPFMAGAMTAANVEARTLQPFDGTLMFCRKIVFPRRTTGATPAKAAWLRARFGVTGRARGNERLYIVRGNGPRRRIVNEPAVVKLLEAHRFRSVDPGALSVAQQAALFADAGIVVGAHGAALTNAIFMGEGAGLIELTHTGRVVNTYHEVAGAAKLNYACVIGDVVGDRSQPVFADFAVDVDALEAALKSVL